MKPRNAIRALLLGSSLLSATCAQAAIVFWDGTDSTANADGGSGTWTTVNAWDTLALAGINASFVANDSVTFGGTAGTVSLTGGVTVGIGANAPLNFTTSGYIIDAASTQLITMNGTGTSILNTTTFNTNVNIALSVAQTLSLTGTSTINGVVSGANGLSVDGTGTLRLSGSTANTYAGLTTVTGGTLELNKSVAVQAIAAGGLTIGAANNTAATVRYTGTSSDMMGLGTLTIRGRGIFDFNGATDTIGNVSIVSTGATTSNPTPIINTLGSGNLTIGTLGITPVAGFISVINAGTSGTITLGGTVTFTAATTGQAQITGQTLALGANRTFSTSLGTGSNYDLDISNAITGAFTLAVSGAGRTRFSGSTANTYAGLTTVTNGTLLLNKSGSAQAIAAGGLTIGAANNTAATVRYTGTSSDMMGLGTLTIRGRGIFDFNGATDTIGNVSIVSTGATTSNPTPIINTLGSGNLTIGTLGITPVAGFISVINAGTSGTITLGGTVTFTAATTGQAQITGQTLALGANRTFSTSLGTGSNYDLDISNAITGAFTLAVSGAGRTRFSGSTANTYAGLTTVTNGTLLLNKSGSAQAIAAGGLTIGAANNTAATVRYTGTSSDMMGLGTLTIRGRGIFDFNGATDTIGNVSIVSTGATTSNPTPIINTLGSGNLTIGTLGITPVAGFISVINAGTSGTITLGGTVTFTAATTGQAQITGQTLALGAATRTFNVGLGTGATQDLLIDAVISGTSVGLIKTGTGRLNLSGANTYTGATTITAGILQVSTLNNGGPGNNSSIGASTNVATNLILNGGTLRYTGAAVSTDRLFSLQFTGTSTIDSSGTGAINFTNTGSMGFNGGVGAKTLALTGTNTGNNTIAAVIANNTGTTAISKTGIGTWVLSGTNTYTGATTVNAGKLVVTGSIGASAVTVNNAGTILATDTAASFGSTLTINANAILAVGDAANATTATATVTGATTFADASIFSWDINATGTSYDKLVTASLTDGGAVGGSILRIVAADSTFANSFWNTAQTWNDIFTTNGTAAIANWASIFTTVTVVNSSFGTITPAAGSFSVSGSTLSWNVIPEPSTALAGLLLAAGLLSRRRPAASVR